MKVMVRRIVIGALGTIIKIGTGTGGLGNKRTSEHYPNYSIVEIGHAAENTPGDLRRPAHSQNFFQQTLV